MFKVYKKEIEVAGKKISLETGKVARQADGAIIATCGETVILATVVGAKKVEELKMHEKDTGSSEVQVALLTGKIETLSAHIKQFKKDKHSSVGLLRAVNRRKKLLEYLKKNKFDSYKNVLTKLNLRK